MAGFSDDFLRFLQVNYPDVFRRASADKVTDATVNSIMSSYGHRYQIWQQIPEWIKNNYGDKIPPEVLNGNETVHDYIEKEKAKQQAKEKETEEMLSFSVNMLALGYAADTVTTLMGNRSERERMLAAANGGSLSAAQFERWLETRREDAAAIAQDWATHQPEKHILHLAKELSRAKKRLGRACSDEQKAEFSNRIAELEKEFRLMSGRLNSRESRQNMVDYLRGQPQQAALRHLDGDVLTMLTGLMEKQGIRIAPVRGGAEQTNARALRHESLTESLREDFARMEQNESIMRDAAQRGRRNSDRIFARAVQKEKKKEEVARTVRLRSRAGRRTQSA